MPILDDKSASTITCGYILLVTCVLMVNSGTGESSKAPLGTSFVKHSTHYSRASDQVVLEDYRKNIFPIVISLVSHSL
jgi:hypothetical protein